MESVYSGLESFYYPILFLHPKSFYTVIMKTSVHEIDLIYSKCPRNSEFRSILAQSEIGFTKLINVGLFDFKQSEVSKRPFKYF